MALIFAWSLAPVSRAATLTWDGSVGDGLWFSNANFGAGAGANPGTGDTVNFDTDLQTAGPYTISLGGGTDSIRNLTFSASAGLAQGYTITNGTLTINNSAGIVNSDADTQTIGATINLATGITINASSGALSLSAITLNANTATIQGNFNTTISGVVSGTGGITKTAGSGVLQLSGNNTYSGTTSFGSGTLDLRSAYALGTGTLTITGGTLTNGSGTAITLANNNTQNWNGNFTYGLSGTGDLNLGTGTVTLSAARTVTVNFGNLIVGGTVTSSNRDLIKAGAGALTLNGNLTLGTGAVEVTAGTLTLAGNNTYSGGTSLESGATLNINSNTALGATAGTFEILGGTIDNTSAGAVTLTNNNAQTWGGNFAFTGTRDLNLGTGAVTFAADRTVTVSASTLTVGGTVTSSNDNLVKAGNGTLVLNGTLALGSGSVQAGAGTLTLAGANTYTGGTTLLAGATLNINSTTALGATSGAFMIGGGTIDNTSGGAITLANNNAQAWFGDFAFTGSNDLNLGTGSVSLTANRQVTVNGGILTVGGVISGSTFGLTKNGAGTLVLNGLNTYDGPTTINAGTLEANTIKDGGPANASSIGDSSSAATNLILNGGTLKLVGSAQSTNRLFSVGTSGGTVDASGSGALVFTNTGDIGFNGQTGARTLTLTGTGEGSLAAALGDNSGATSLVKNGTGAWTLSGNSTFSGGTALNAGTLNINSATAIGSGTFTIAGGTIDNTSGGLITLANNNASAWNGDFAFTGTNSLDLGNGTVTLGGNRSLAVNANTLSVGAITDGASSFSLTKNGSGTLTLNGAGSYDGGVVLNSGSLVFGHANAASALGTGTFTIAGGTIDNTSGALLTLSTNNLQAWNGNFSFAGTDNLNLGDGAVTLGATRTITTTSGTLIVDGAISDGGGGYGLIKEGSGTLRLRGPASNTFTGLTTVNRGTLTLAKTGGATAIAGNIVIGDGTGSDELRLNNPNQIADTAAVTLTAGGTPVFNLNDNSERIGSLASTNSSAVVQFGTPGSATTLTVGDATSTTYAGTFTSGNALPSLMKEGTGTLTLTGASTGFTGGVTVNAGTLNVQHGSALGVGTAGTTVGTGASLALQGGITANNGPLSLQGAGVGGLGALTNVSGDNTWSGNITLADSATIGTQGGTLTLGTTRPFFPISGHDQPAESGYVTIGDRTLTFSGNGTSILVNSRIRDFAGQIAGTSFSDATTIAYQPETTSPGNVLVNMTNGGSVTFAANANSYTGSTTVQAGTLVLGTAPNIAAPHDNVTDSFHSINGSLIIGSNSNTTTATVRLDGNETIGIGSPITLYKDGTLNINDNSQTVGALTFNGGAVALGYGTLYLNSDVTVNASAGNTATISGVDGRLSMTLNRAGGVDTGPDATRTFDVVGGAGNQYDLAISGVLQNGNLVKAGNGTMLLSSVNEYTGSTSVTGGILNIQAGTSAGSSGLGAGNGTVNQGTSVSSGATLQLQGGVAVTTEMLTLSGSGYNSLGALNNASGNNTFGAAGNTLINLADDARINSSGGTLTIAGNTSSSANNALTVGGAGNTTISGAINTGVGSSSTLTKDGTGTLILSGSNSYQGATNITAGILQVQHNFGLGATSTGPDGTFVTGGAELRLSHATGLTIGGESLSIAGAGVGGSSGALNNLLGDNTFGGLVTLTDVATIKSTSDSLTLAGGIASANHALTVVGSGDVIVTGAISNGSGTLTKQDAGTLTFAGTTNGTTGTVGAVNLEGGTIAVGNGTQTTFLNTGNFAADAGTTLSLATGGTVVATYTGSTTYSGVMAGSGTFEKTGAGTLVFDNSFTASNLTLKLSGGTLSLLGAQITVGTIHITGNTILDFNNSAGTFLSSANLVINAGVTVTVNNWVSVANNTALSTVWYATNTINAGTLGGTDQVGGTPLGTGTPGQPGVVFTGYTPGLTPTWVSGNHNGWFDHEIRPTPEPSTYGAIFISSALALLGWRRFKRKNKSATQSGGFGAPPRVKQGTF